MQLQLPIKECRFSRSLMLVLMIGITVSCSQKDEEQDLSAEGDHPVLSADIINNTEAKIHYLAPLPSSNNVHDVHLKLSPLTSTESHQAILRFQDNGNKVLEPGELIGAVLVGKKNEYTIGLAHEQRSLWWSIKRMFQRRYHVRRYETFFNIGGNRIIHERLQLINNMNPFAEDTKTNYKAERLIGSDKIKNSAEPAWERRLPTDKELHNKMVKGTQLLEERLFGNKVKFRVPVADPY